MTLKRFLFHFLTLSTVVCSAFCFLFFEHVLTGDGVMAYVSMHGLSGGGEGLWFLGFILPALFVSFSLAFVVDYISVRGILRLFLLGVILGFLNLLLNKNTELVWWLFIGLQYLFSATIPVGGLCIYSLLKWKLVKLKNVGI